MDKIRAAARQAKAMTEQADSVAALRGTTDRLEAGVRHLAPQITDIAARLERIEKALAELTQLAKRDARPGRNT